MGRRPGPDRILFATTLALVLVGVVMVFSASAVVATEMYGRSYVFLAKQALGVVLGIGAMLAMMSFDYHRLRHPATVFTSVSVMLVLLASVFFLDKSHATHRWVRLGPFSLQPSELAKLVLVVFLAYLFEKGWRDERERWRTLLSALGVVLLTVTLVVVQPDLGTAADLLLIAVTIAFVAGLPVQYLAYLALAGIPAFYLLVVRVKYRYDRIVAFLDPYADPQGKGFQIIQSLIAVGTGGITGVGLMDGKQKLFYLPEAHTDFIFAVVGEELGLLGATIIITLFSVFLWRALRVVLRAPDELGRLLAAGVTVTVIGQALINLSVVLGLLPTKGIPLPFISYGGSGLVVMLTAVGILLNISQYVEE